MTCAMTIKELVGPELPEKPVARVRATLKSHAFQYLIGMAGLIGWSLWCLGEADYTAAKNGLYAIAFWTLFSLLRIHTETFQILSRLETDEAITARRAESRQR